MSHFLPPQRDIQPTWVDVFPWLEAYADALPSPVPTVDWHLQAVNDADYRQRQEILFLVASIALEQLSKWTIGEIFPTLPSETSLTTLSFTTRARTVLARKGLTVLADIEDIEVEELLGFTLPGGWDS